MGVLENREKLHLEEQNRGDWGSAWEEGMEWNHFMTILLLDPYFKINGWIYRSILGVLVKKSLNLTSFPHIPLNFMGNENLRFLGNRE